MLTIEGRASASILTVFVCRNSEERAPARWSERAGNGNEPKTQPAKTLEKSRSSQAMGGIFEVGGLLCSANELIAAAGNGWADTIVSSGTRAKPISLSKA